MENISTAFLFVNKGKLRHNLGRPSRSDFVQSEFMGVKDMDQIVEWAKELQSLLVQQKIK